MRNIYLTIAALLLVTPVASQAQFSLYEQDESRMWMAPDLRMSELSCADILPLLFQAGRDVAERNIQHPDLPLAADLTARAAQRFDASPEDGICRQDGLEALQLYRGMLGLY